MVEVAAGILVATAEDPSGIVKAFLEEPEQAVRPEGMTIAEIETDSPPPKTRDEVYVRFDLIPPASRTTEPEESSSTGIENGVVPNELEPYAEQLMNGEGRKRRLVAADKILVYSPASSVPDYLLAVARLQKAETCDAKGKALQEIREIGDSRALPALRRLSSQRRTGCGPRKSKDCLVCLRQDLTTCIKLFDSRGSP
jgi:hypothetical protein